MQIYPETPKQGDVTTITPVWKTLIGQFEAGSEQRRSVWMFPLYDVNFRHPQLSSTNAKTIWEFYMARKGSMEAFFYYDRFSFDHKNIFVVVGDGTTDIFDIPGRSTSSRTLYVNGAVTTTGFAYLSGGGDGGADRIDFTSAPAAGAIITIDFTGYLRIKCRFEEDRLNRENFTANLFRYGIKLKGCR